MRPKCKSESGFTTLIFLSLLLMLTLLGVNAIMTSTTEIDIAGYELNSTSCALRGGGGSGAGYGSSESTIQQPRRSPRDPSL